MYDVIVIGARCAGATTAMLLARHGHRVLLLDRARFPSDIPHGHLVQQQGPVRLQRWGLLDRITASNCPSIESVRVDFGDSSLASDGLTGDSVAIAYAPRRKVLDQILVEAAVAAGAELRESCLVEGFLTEGDRIVGIRARDKSGKVFSERATITVGADGRNSLLARIVDAPAYEAVPTLTCYAFSYWSGVAERGLWICNRPKSALFCFPTNDNLFAVFATAPIAEAPLMRANMESYVMATVALVPDLAEALRNGRREERFYGAADLPNFFRKPHGPGWALVGDAGHHKDPYLALGVSDALRDAEFLSDALNEGFCGRAPFDAALEAYEQRRNEAAMPLYRENLRSAQFLPPPPEFNELRAALRTDPEVRRQFFMARFGRGPKPQLR